MVAFLFLVLLASCSASDMSIISYDLAHGGEPGRRSDAEVAALYESWLAKHGKAYHNALVGGEKERRFEIFKENLRLIDEHNSRNRTYALGLNRFADLTNEEYRSTYLGGRPDARRRLARGRSSRRYEPRVGEALPDSVDWREEGAVGGVEDQGSCDELPRSI